MIHRIPFIIGLAMALGVFGLAPNRASAQTFRIDPIHSWITFQIKHLQVADAWGQATGPKGTINIDADPSRISFDVQVPADGIMTGNSGRDTHLKGPDFFDAKQFPAISFKSTAVKMNGQDYEVTGDFTLHGVTKSITVTLRKSGERDTGGQTGYRAGFEGTFTIKRSDHGMGAMQNIIGDDATIHLSLEAQRQ
ncbi:MAG TPA: YceI family protein [Tepidisphaeraceae bacterium]|nr:YceI family protein [Tepidisphaeraceae bacterium]